MGLVGGLTGLCFFAANGWAGSGWITQDRAEWSQINGLTGGGGLG